MKNFYKLAFVFSFLLVLVFMGFDYSFFDRGNTADIELSPYSDIYEISSEIYYVNDKYLLDREKIAMTVSMSNYIELVFELIKRPSSKLNTTSALDKDVRLIDYQINEGELTVNVSKDLLESELWKNGHEYVVVYSIVNSYCALDTFEEVFVEVEGVNVHRYLDEIGDSSFSFNDSYVYQEPNNPSEVVSSFLNYVFIDRNDLAFLLTAESNEYDLSLTNFEERVANKFDKYRDKGYYVSYTTEKSNKYYVLVMFYNDNYYYPEQYFNITLEVVEMPDKSYKILF